MPKGSEGFKNPVEMIQILRNLIMKSKNQSHRDIASHILVILVDAWKFDKCEQDAKHVLNHISNEKNFKNDLPCLSYNALTFALMTLVKTNELANEFATSLGFKILHDLLDGPCMNSPQIAYNVITTIWILSYNERGIKFL